uniref:Candidate secreted effector n=1 Tax=Meloidogyne incognita TaxID=6306 RepID=A0A914MZT2_MELIC
MNERIIRKIILFIISFIRCIRRLQNSTPLTELPILSKAGDHKAIPIIFGTTTIITPETPDFAGNPTWKANWPEYSSKKEHRGMVWNQYNVLLHSLTCNFQRAELEIKV